ncbi:MAG: CHAD domain-containing protein [Chloroflexota bacterium]
MSEELELKFIVEDPAAARAWMDHRLGISEPWQTIQIIDRYFDTADLALSVAGYGARLRQMGRQTLITVKSDIEVVGGLHRREELEAPAARALDPVKWPESDARTRVLEVVGARRLIERFRVEQERHEVEAAVDGALVVASMDEGDVWAAGRLVGSLRQLEIELRSGDETVLRGLADEITAASIGVAEPRSKLAIALSMVAAAEKIQPTDTMAAAGRLVLRRQLLRMLERESAARTGDPLAIKQMRVATRRMRAAWRVFGDAYQKRSRRRYVAELRRVADALGEVRDLDVLLAGLPDDEALAPLAEAWRQRRALAHARLMTLLYDSTYEKFVADYLDFTSAPGAGLDNGASPTTMAQAATTELIGGADAIRAAATAVFANGDDEAWHTLRIGSRRLRYSVEQLREQIGESAATAAIANLVRIQDCLGAMNDAAVAANEAESWLAAHPHARLTTKGAIRSYVTAQHDAITRLRGEFAPIWQEASGLFTER